jgi:hypothetical protein
VITVSAYTGVDPICIWFCAAQKQLINVKMQASFFIMIKDTIKLYW